MSTDNNFAVPEDLLRSATTVPQGKNLEEIDPMEKIPTMGVGDDGWTNGMTLSGYYDGDQEIPSAKASKKNEEGKSVFLRHILRVGSPTGKKLGLWSVASLENFFRSIDRGTFVSITFKGKSQHPTKPAQTLNNFEFKIEKPSLNS